MGGKVYLVIQKGVYHHPTFGVFAREADALLAAEAMVRGEYDHYHDAEVYAVNVGEAPPREEPRPLHVASWDRFAGRVVVGKGR